MDGKLVLNKDELKSLKVLAIDCQATGSQPKSSHLLEIGWVQTSAAEIIPEKEIKEQTEAYLIRPSRGASPPPKHVLRITGIKSADLKRANPSQKVWELLNQAVRKVSKSHTFRPVPTVIHFCRYEEPYLRKLHSDWGKKNETFPLDIICSHQIVLRLYPGLPRKGLRTITGFFGYSLPEQRRCRPHVMATALIWRQLVQELSNQVNLTSFSELKAWLAEPIISSTANKKSKRIYPMDKKLREGLPDRSGIYRMYRSSGDILYVGKTKSLKKRVNSYFQSRGRHAEHILEMLSQAKDLTFTLTHTALEAAVLEADEIKRLSPPFNRALQQKDRKITYASSDLMSFRYLRPNHKHPEGPFTSRQHVAPMGILAHFLSGNSNRINTRIMEKILDFSRAHLPNLSTFRKGVQAFQSEYKEMIPETLDLPVIKTLGSLFWKEKIAEKTIDPDVKEEPEETEDESNIDLDIWTPEQVVKVLKSIIRHGTFHIRRAQWLLRLSESTLLWSDKEEPQTKHMLVIEKGKVHFPNPEAAGAKIPVLSSHASSLMERREGFDLAVYDRLRVLTTEIRRLVDDGRFMELWLHPGVQLNQEKLKKMLPWV